MNGSEQVENGPKRVMNSIKQVMKNKKRVENAKSSSDNKKLARKDTVSQKCKKRKNSAHSEDKIKQDLISSSDAIRKKYKKLKLSESKVQQDLQNTFKPIVDPLQKILKVQEIIKDKNNIIRESKSTETDFKSIENDLDPITNTYEEPDYESAKESNDQDENEEEMLEFDVDEEEMPVVDIEEVHKQVKTLEGQRIAQMKSRNLGVYASKYVLLHSQGDHADDLDKVYGPRFDGQRWLLGNSYITMNDDKIHLKGKEYNGSPGLFELLFMNYPDKELYTERDLAKYKRLLEETNGHKRAYAAKQQKNSNRGYKYMNIIMPLFAKTTKSAKTAKTGSGMSVNKPIYEYWDDPNELCDRLRLLLSSNAAGHNNHQNEIASIVEELLEAKYIL